ncbi:MAG: hypothetical protein GY768_31735 [Planctomycetaceae bacterium]|nr:hypothetical protein [Planctomycetaceae bacterium]
MQLRWLIVISLLVLMIVSGCTRRQYRLRADADATALLDEKSVGTPWQLPADYSVYPASGSRLADPTNPDRPVLPPPGPVLYQSRPISADDPVSPDALGPGDIPRLLGRKVQTTQSLAALKRLPKTEEWSPSVVEEVRLVSAAELLQPPEPLPLTVVDEVELEQQQEAADVQPVPAEYWDALPTNCLRRMNEFKSVRSEYSQEYGSPPERSRQGPKLSLSRIVDLGRQNSRAYQTEKETLYVAALGVSLDRYDYYLKFSRAGNGSDVDYQHTRTNGDNRSRLFIPSAFQVDRMLATGGTILARFANDVLLTFNGPDGFTSDIASELLFDFTQEILQRDVLLEPLIQSERQLVYAARDFTRYRKQFFLELARQYYEILRTYREIEIASQNYFSLVRTVEQAQAEIRAEVQKAPNQVAVDQYEQEMLSGRRDLINACNGLELKLDALKLVIGLPTEAEINVDLAELDRLTLLDEMEVAAERVRRWRRRVEAQRAQPLINRGDLLNPSYFLLERLIQWMRLRQQGNEISQVPPELPQLLLDINVDIALVEVERAEFELSRAEDPGVPQPTILLYQRTSDVIQARLELAQRQLTRLRAISAIQSADLENWDLQIQQAMAAFELLKKKVADILENPEQARLDALLEDTRALRVEVNRIDQALRVLAGWAPNITRADRKRATFEITDRLLQLTTELLQESQGGLPAVNISENDAMLTALIQRLDLMNRRGFLADDWRQIKYAADDLRSVLNFNATHSLRNERNEPFNFDFDSSRTDLRLSLDLPLNRRLQRNTYRRSLINYQQGRRSLMELEDTIKFEIRDDLRQLERLRVQYPISVTRAALAAEQVISVQLQLSLGIEGVRGTDLLLALQTSRESLQSVANDRLKYLVDRAQFVLNLELMQLDSNGFWPEINNPNYQPQPRTVYPRNAGPTYGQITPWVKPSKLIYQIYRHPLPGDETVLIRGVPIQEDAVENLPDVQPIGPWSDQSEFGQEQSIPPVPSVESIPAPE